MRIITFILIFIFTIITFTESSYAQSTFSVYGRLTDKYNNPIQSTISVGLYSNSTDSNGNYFLQVPQGTYDVNYSLQDFWIELSSVNINSNMKDIVSLVTRYNNNISFTFDLGDEQLLQLYIQNKPNKISINNTGITEASSLSNLNDNTWFFDSNVRKLYVKTKPDYSLIGYWKFDEGSGSVAKDSSPYHNDGTLYNSPAWVNGISGQALQFNGVNNYANVTSANLAITGSKTVEAWVNPSSFDNPGSVARRIVSERIDGSNDYMLTVWVNKGFVFAVHDSGVEYIVSTNNIGAGYPANSWYNLIGTYDSITHAIGLYVNGLSKNDGNAAGFSSGTINGFVIGERSDGQGFFNGTIDEVKIWNRTLSDDEIKKEYNKVVQQCSSDGTPYGSCSATKPKYCDSNGNLLDNYCYGPDKVVGTADDCGCPSGVCQSDGSCAVTTCDSTCKSKGYGSGTCEAGTSGGGYNPPLHVSGTQLKDANGNTVILRGVNYVDWDWMTQGQNQFAIMKSWGINSVRLTISTSKLEQIYKGGVITDPTYLSQLDNVINWAQAQGIYVILDGWQQWGSTSPSGYAANDVSHYFKDNYANGVFYFSDWYNWWKTLATRYNGKGVIYDLMNEPLYWNNADHQTRIRQCIDNIRAIDSNAIVMVEVSSPGDWDRQNFAFEQSYPISRSNILYSYHIYGYHGAFVNGDNSQSNIRSALSSYYASWMLANGRCVESGEFGGREQSGDQSAWSLTFMQNFMTVSDADGYSGYLAWDWNLYDFDLIKDWSGTPSVSGTIIKNYYSSHQTPSTSCQSGETPISDSCTSGTCCCSGTTTCSCGTWTNGACGAGGCASNYRQQTRTCSPSGCNVTSQCVADSTCGTPNGLKVFQNSTSNYLQNKAGQVIMSSSDATAIINAAIANAVSGDTIYIDAGTYVMTGSVSSQSKNGITLTLATNPNAILRLINGFPIGGVPPISLVSVSNWVIQGGEIDGNAQNQILRRNDNGAYIGPYVTIPSVSISDNGNFFELKQCTNCTIQNMSIHDCRVDGIVIYYGSKNCNVLNNHVWNCGANGVTMGDDWNQNFGGPGATTNGIIKGNLIEHFNDVGISNYGVNGQCVNNTIQNFGYACPGYVGTEWGVGLEGVFSAGNTVQGNSIDGAIWGICQGTGHSGINTNQQIINNIIRGGPNALMGIQFQQGDGNTVSYNSIANFPRGIVLDSNNNVGSVNTYSSVGIPVSGSGKNNHVT